MSRAGNWNRQDGFTLVELGVVMLLLVLFSVLTIPVFGGFGSNRLNSSARRLAGTVKYLYNESALSGLSYRIVYDLDQEAYRAERVEANGDVTEVGGTGRGRELGGDVRFEDVTLVDRGKYTSGQVTEKIEPVGWLEEAVIHLKEGDRQLTLHLQPFTGTTKVYEGYREIDRSGPEARALGR